MTFANHVSVEHLTNSLERAERSPHIWSMHELPRLETPSEGAVRHHLVPGEVKHVWQLSLDDDTFGADDDRNVWNHFPDMLPYNIGQAVANYRKHLRVAKARLELGNKKYWTDLIKQRCGQTYGQAHVSNCFPRSTHRHCRRRGKLN